MKTLTDEALGRTPLLITPNRRKREEWGRTFAAGIKAGLGPYGDWRVVEGWLSYIAEHEESGRSCRIFDERLGDGGNCLVEWHEGDHVKIILPPEEKEVERTQRACAMFKSNKWTLDDCRRVWLGVDEPPGEKEDGWRQEFERTDEALQETIEERDKYEKALREIARSAVLKPGTWETLVHDARATARKALDE